MSLESYTFNISRQSFVRSFDEPQQVAAPVFGNTDARDFDVTFVRNVGNARVEVIQSVVSAQIAISDPATPGTVMTSVTAGAASNNAFPFVLPISGAAIVTFMAGVTKPKAALCEFRILTAAGVNRYQTTLYLAPNQTTDATADPTATSPAITLADFGAIGVPKEVPMGMAWIWTDEADGQKYQVRLVNKQFTFEPLG